MWVWSGFNVGGSVLAFGVGMLLRGMITDDVYSIHEQSCVVNRFLNAELCLSRPHVISVSSCRVS